MRKTLNLKRARKQQSPYGSEYKAFCAQDDNFHKSGGTFNKCALPINWDPLWYSNYVCDDDRNRLMSQYKELEELRAEYEKLQCVYNTYVAYRYRTDENVSINCAKREVWYPDYANKVPTCIRANSKGRYTHNGVTNHTYKYYLNMIGDEEAQIRSKITETQKEIEYEIEQRQNLNTQREEKGITQRDLNILYPEMEEVVEELAPQSDLNDLIDDEKDPTDQWVYAGIATLIVGGLTYLAYRKFGA